MIIKRICILGGSGFVGQTLANCLNDEGYQLRILTRDREACRENLILLPNLELVETNIHDIDQLKQNFIDCDAVINLVGILNEKGRSGEGFRYAHVGLVEKIIAACHENRIKRLLHMSALNADVNNGPSYYLRSKGEAEDKLHNTAGLYVTSFRPSVIFGSNDSFFNRFAKLLKLTPLVFPLACAQARFAPVYVKDVAEAFCRTLLDPDAYGKRYNLCGPSEYTLHELVQYTLECIGINRLIVPLPDIISRIQGAIFDFIPGKPFSTDNYLSTKVDSICACNDLETLGITPSGLEGIVPRYLSNRTQRARYYLFREHSRRN